MTTKDYIESGVLESYVMGHLSEKEMRKVQCMALVHEDIAKELESIEVSFEQMALDTAVVPSESLQERIWSDVKASRPMQQAPVVPMPASLDAPKTGFSWARAASVAVLLGLSFLLWKNYETNKTLTAQLDEQSSRVSEYAASLEKADAKYEDIESQLAIIGSPDFQSVTMKGTENAPASLAQVYWNAQNSELYLDIRSMADLADGKVYQLWALDNGVPVDAGTFSPDKTGLLRMKSIASGQAFAVTIENEGGAESPALETLQVIGNVPVSS